MSRTTKLSPRAAMLLLIGITVPLSVACAPPSIGSEEDQDEGATKPGCEQFEFGDACFVRVDFGLEDASATQLATDLDEDGDDELVIRSGSHLVIADFEGTEPSLQTIDAPLPTGPMIDAQVASQGGRELILSNGVTYVLGAAEGSIEEIAVSSQNLGRMGAIGRVGEASEAVVHGGTSFTVSTFAGDAWNPTGEEFPIPGCGVNDSAIQGDFNGDGLVDAVFMGTVGGCDAAPDADAPTPLLLVWEKDGQLLGTERAPGPRLSRGSVGDVDGDRVDDLLLWAPGGDTGVLMYGDANAPLNESLSLSVGAGQQLVGLADLDGDGRRQAVVWSDDFIWAVPDPQTLDQLVQLLPTHEFVRFADLNGDGIDDVVDRSAENLGVLISGAKQ